MARHDDHPAGVYSAVDRLATDPLDDRADLVRNQHRRGVIYGPRPLVCGLGLDHGIIVRRFWRSLRVVSLSADFRGAVCGAGSRINLWRHANDNTDHAGIMLWTRLRHGRCGGHHRLENRSDFRDFLHRIDRLSRRPYGHDHDLPTDDQRGIPAACCGDWRNRHPRRCAHSMARTPTLAKTMLINFQGLLVLSIEALRPCPCLS